MSAHQSHRRPSHTTDAPTAGSRSGAAASAGIIRSSCWALIRSVPDQDSPSRKARDTGAATSCSRILPWAVQRTRNPVSLRVAGEPQPGPWTEHRAQHCSTESASEQPRPAAHRQGHPLDACRRPSSSAEQAEDVPPPPQTPVLPVSCSRHWNPSLSTGAAPLPSASLTASFTQSSHLPDQLPAAVLAHPISSPLVRLEKVVQTRPRRPKNFKNLKP